MSYLLFSQIVFVRGSKGLSEKKKTFIGMSINATLHGCTVVESSWAHYIVLVISTISFWPTKFTAEISDREITFLGKRESLFSACACFSSRQNLSNQKRLTEYRLSLPNHILMTKWHLIGNQPELCREKGGPFKDILVKTNLWKSPITNPKESPVWLVF